MKPQRLEWGANFQDIHFLIDRAVILGVDNNHGDAQIIF